MVLGSCTKPRQFHFLQSNLCDDLIQAQSKRGLCKNLRVNRLIRIEIPNRLIAKLLCFNHSLLPCYQYRRLWAQLDYLGVSVLNWKVFVVEVLNILFWCSYNIFKHFSVKTVILSEPLGCCCVFIQWQGRVLCMLGKCLQRTVPLEVIYLSSPGRWLCRLKSPSWRFSVVNCLLILDSCLPKCWYAQTSSLALAIRNYSFLRLIWGFYCKITTLLSAGIVFRR